MVLAAIFRVENSTFTKYLRVAIQSNNITQTILKKMGQGDIKEFTKKKLILTILKKNLCTDKTPKRDYYRVI